MTYKEKILAEIEWLMSNRSKTLVDGSYWDYKGLIDFINSLPEESASEEAAKAAEEYRRYREECGIKDPVMLNEIEEAYFIGVTQRRRGSVSEDLEKVAEEYTKEYTCKPWRNLCKEALKAGARWSDGRTSNNFMRYLDENRPQGKMCLSNGECVDIEKAFREQDWGKLFRYMKKYDKEG